MLFGQWSVKVSKCGWVWEFMGDNETRERERRVRARVGETASTVGVFIFPGLAITRDERGPVTSVFER